jgi:hypothetical protein
MPSSVREMLAEANTAVPRLSPAEVRDRMTRGDVLIVDVRDAPELAAGGKLRGALHVSRGMLEFRADLRAPLTTRRFRRTKPSSSTAGREVARRWSARPSKTSATNRSSMPAGLRTWPTPAWRRSRRN